MNSSSFLLFLIFLVNFHESYGQVLSCSFRNDSNYGYTCDLTIQNPNGFNNFTVINGTHLVGMSESDVRYINRVSGSNTKNFPSIICEKFQYTTRMYLQGMRIQIIDEYSFENCKNLSYLDLTSNLITNVDEKSFSENLELTFLSIWTNQLTVLPENVFVNQQKLVTLWLDVNKITDLPKNIFNSLNNLNRLYLQNNKITNLRIEWFEQLDKLSMLILGENQIEELPKNVFNSLKALESIYIYGNKLKVIHSDSFGILSNLTEVNLYNNQINAIDEKFIDNTGVQWLDMNNNICASVFIIDSSDSRQSMRNALQTCFDNYKTLYPETTTVTPTTISSTATEEPTTTKSQTLPPGCIDGNLDERVCRLEDKNEDLEQKIEDILREKDEMQENLENQIQNLQNNFNDALEDLQNQILILSTRPCSCH